jgi:hypothetical protein
MSLFSRILDKLGLRKDQPDVVGTDKVIHPEPPATMHHPEADPGAKLIGSAPVSDKGVKTTTSVGHEGKRDAFDRPQGAATPRTMSQVNVMNMLEEKAKGTGLNWKQSISDLLFLLDIDNSRAARTELAKELDAPDDVMSDSAKMNVWLHKTVLKKIAENGGNIPKELLD